MCGIFAQIRRSANLRPPDLKQVSQLLQGVVEQLQQLSDDANALDADLLQESVELERAAYLAQQANLLLSGLAGFTALANNTELAAELSAGLSQAENLIPAALENPQLLDALWSIRHDRLQTANKALKLLGNSSQSNTLQCLSEFQLGAALSIQTALSALDRLEVRGRDSAGLSIILPRLETGQLPTSLFSRQYDDQFTNGSVRFSAEAGSRSTPARSQADLATVCFTYKVAATIGKLGDNSQALYHAISADSDLRECLAIAQEHALVLAHTRWASLGEISQANAHPLDSTSASGRPAEAGISRPLVIAAVNGDIDNHSELLANHDLAFPTGVTTDSKVVPLLISKSAHNSDNLAQAFATAVEQFEGSAALAACSLDNPDKLLLSVFGSGQSLYVGLANDSFVVASEPYGILEQTNKYIRLGGGKDTVKHASEAVTLSTENAGKTEGIANLGSNRTVSEIITAEITTRDVTRGKHAHYLLKEISQSPLSVSKTLQSQVSPENVLAELFQGGKVEKIVAIGQGTAAIAAKAFAEICYDEIQALSKAGASFEKSGAPFPSGMSSPGDALAQGRVPFPHRASLPEVSAMAASELSGFAMDSNMSNHVIVAISQSGTTTDTNRTVDLLQSRGATVVAIVNRRNSDLSHKADCVMYTSDGRDIEMSVASTKAFYSQVTAGSLLAFQMVDHLAAKLLAQDKQGAWQHRREQKLKALATLPSTLATLLERREKIGQTARTVTTQRRDLAVVGSGRDRIAAQEVRIKLSELCYKSVSVDSIEDKKHIDLSSEPLILVCAAGIEGSNVEDIFKEVSIYCAHRACPVVFVADGIKFSAPKGAHVISVPVAGPELGFVSSAMAGHLFAYEAALTIDALADPLRETKLTIEQALADMQSLSDLSTVENNPAEVLAKMAKHWEETHEPIAAQGKIYADGLAEQRYDGYVDASLAVELSSLYKYSGGLTSLSSFQQEFGSVGTPEKVWQRFSTALAEGIEALTRPIDAIRHQAKTVTVGITRTDEALAASPLVVEVLAAGASREALTYETLRELSALALTVEETSGHTRYLLRDGKLAITSRSGVSEGIKSQVDTDPDLRGTKHRVMVEQRVFLTCGRRDKRTIILVPEVLNSQTTAITLLHVKLRDYLPAQEAVAALKGYRDRYEALWGAVTETEKNFDVSHLETISVEDLFMEPIVTLSERWRDS